MATNKLKFKPPRLSMSSPVPAIFMTRKHVKNYNNLVNNAIDRLDWGRMLFLLAAAEIVKKRIQETAPEIKVGAKTEIPYARDLRIALLQVGKKESSIALYFDSSKFKVSEKDEGKIALYFRPISGSPEWVGVLQRHGPWPTDMLPFHVHERQAKVVSRYAREDELNSLKGNLLHKRDIVEAELKMTKAPRSEIQGDEYNASSGNAVGIVANDDIGYNVLRTEFGYDGNKQVSHWRPALRELGDQIPSLMKKYLTYIQNGREDVFDIPVEVLKMTSADYNKGDYFAKALAPFAPQG